MGHDIQHRMLLVAGAIGAMALLQLGAWGFGARSFASFIGSCWWVVVGGCVVLLKLPTRRQ